MSVSILVGDCREKLRGLPSASAHCCVTSPPYFGLRDYGVEQQIGLERTPDQFVAALVDVMREVRRVLRDDGTLWLNLGDSYNNRTSGGPGATGGADKSTLAGRAPPVGSAPTKRGFDGSLTTKDLIGIPWRVAFALQNDGWCLRQDIIWEKPNPMPDPVKDRCTNSHEYLFLLTKSQRYHFDGNAIAEPSCANDDRPQTRRAIELANKGGLTDEHISALRACGVSDAGKARVTQNGFGKNDPSIQALADHAKEVLGGYYREFLIGKTRNKRSVWTIPTQPFSDAHFATFPPDLIKPCILAGCPEGGTVIDPFGGAGTTGLVADRLKRHAVLIEINPEYAALAETRLRKDGGMFMQASVS